MVVNFNYRLSPQNKYPAAIEDVAYLIRYIHENAQTLGIDMDNFYMVGDSAGAQLTANLCQMFGVGTFTISDHDHDVHPGGEGMP